MDILSWVHLCCYCRLLSSTLFLNQYYANSGQCHSIGFSKCNEYTFLKFKQTMTSACRSIFYASLIYNFASILSLLQEIWLFEGWSYLENIYYIFFCLHLRSAKWKSIIILWNIGLNFLTFSKICFLLTQIFMWNILNVIWICLFMWW